MVAQSVQLHQDVDVMTSHFVRMMPEVAAVDRESTSECDVFPAKRGVTKKPPRRNRPRSRRGGSHVSRDGLSQEPRVGRRSKMRDNSSEAFRDDDDDKENSCRVNRCRSARSDLYTSQRPVASPSKSPSRSLVYQQCLGSVIASYLSPGRGQAFIRSRRYAQRFFDTLTSPGDETPATKPSNDDHKNEDGNGNDDNNNTNTSVWLSDSSLPDVETSSGVETATSSPPEARPDGDDVIREEVRDGSKFVALCDVSRISVVSSTSVPREQLSSVGGGGLAGIEGGPSSAFHSTFNYPLHSTLRGTSVRCPSPLPESPTSPVYRGEPEVCQEIEDRRPRPVRHRDLPPPACRRCVDSTPLRRQHARARLERQRPLVDRGRLSARRLDDYENVQLTSVSLHATRGSLPDLSDLSTDSELYEQVARGSRRERLRCGLNPGVFDVNVEAPVRRHRPRTSCKHCRCHSTRPCVQKSADPLTTFDPRRNDASHHVVDVAWSRTPSSDFRRYAHTVSTQPSLQRPRPTGCVPSIRNHDDDAAVVMETRRRRRRRRRRQGVDLGCGHKRLLSKKLKLFSNILCSARAADVTQLTTLGHV